MADLQLRGLEKRYGAGDDAVVALAPVDLDLDDDEIVAVVGPSGCGKTTLLRIVAGLTPPSRGTVTVGGQPVWDGGRVRREAVRDVAVVFQESNLLPWMSVAANVALPLRLRGTGRRERLARAAELCEVVGIGGFERKRPSQLSIGMRHRAAIARGLIEDPRILLLDEPFAALDALTREAMNLELQRVWLRRPCTYVLVTHSITEAVFLADRVVSLTARPARVAGVTHVPFERPRPLELQRSAEFQELVHEVRELLDRVS